MQHNIVLPGGTKAPTTGPIIPVYFRHGVVSLGVGNVLGLPTLFVTNSSESGMMSPPDSLLKTECMLLLKQYLGRTITLTALLQTYQFAMVRRELEASGALYMLNGVPTLRVGFEEEVMEQEDN